jgi:predicted kinase
LAKAALWLLRDLTRQALLANLSPLEVEMDRDCSWVSADLESPRRVDMTPRRRELVLMTTVHNAVHPKFELTVRSRAIAAWKAARLRRLETARQLLLERRSEARLAARARLPILILLMGIPGSGKSKWAHEFMAHPRRDTFGTVTPFSLVSSDDVRRSITGDINDQTQNTAVWRAITERTASSLNAGTNVVLDSTNCETAKRRTLLRALPECRLCLRVFPIHAAVARQRISRDVATGVDRANVPPRAVDQMHRHFNESLTMIRDEGWQLMRGMTIPFP